MTRSGEGEAQPPPPPPSLPQLSPPPGRHTHTRTDSLTMSLRVWLCCNQGDKQGVDGWSPPWGPTCPAPPHPPQSPTFLVLYSERQMETEEMRKMHRAYQ